MKEVYIVLIDNKQRLLDNQLIAWSDLSLELTGNRAPLLENKVSFELGECRFIITGKRIEFSRNLKNNEIPDDVKRNLLAYVEQYSKKKTLFVIDLCLNKAQNDGEGGVLVKELIVGQGNRKRNFLYVTAVLGLIDDKDTILRASTSEDKLDNNAFAMTICKFYPNSEAEEVVWEEHYSEVLKLLRSRFLNRQYFGAILMRAIKLAGVIKQKGTVK